MQKNPINKLNSLLLSLNPYEYTTLAYLIGLLLSENLNYVELQSFGNFFEQIGQTLITIGQQAENKNNSANENIKIDDLTEFLKNKIGNIEKIIAEFKSL